MFTWSRGAAPSRTTPACARLAFPYMKSIPAPTDRTSFTFHATVGLTTNVMISTFVTWFRKMLVLRSRYSCPSPNGTKTPIPYAKLGEAFLVQ